MERKTKIASAIAAGFVLAGCSRGNNSEGNTCDFTYTEAATGKEKTEQVEEGTRLRINHPDNVQFVICEDETFRNPENYAPANVRIDKNEKGEVTDIRQ